MSATAQSVPTGGGFSVPQIPGQPAGAPQIPGGPPAVPNTGVVQAQPVQQQVTVTPPVAVTPASQQQYEPQQQPQQRQLSPAELLALSLGGVQVQQQPVQQPAPQVPAQQPQVPVQQPAAKPTGGLNDIDPKTLENAELRNLGELLIMSAPGLDIDRTLGNAIAAADPKLIDRKYLTEAFGDKATALIGVAERIVEAARMDAEKTVQGIYAQAGSEAQWKASMAAFNTNAPDYLKQAAQSLLDSTNSSKILQGAKLIVDFATQGGFVQQAQPGLVPQGGNAGAQGLTKAAFQAELQKLNKNAADYVEQRNMLFYRRQQGKNRGM